MHSKCTPSTYVSTLSRLLLLLLLPFLPNLSLMHNAHICTSPFWECNWQFRCFNLCRRWFYLDGKPWWLIKWQVALNDSCLKVIMVTFTWAWICQGEPSARGGSGWALGSTLCAGDRPASKRSPSLLSQWPKWLYRDWLVISILLVTWLQGAYLYRDWLDRKSVV